MKWDVRSYALENLSGIHDPDADEMQATCPSCGKGGHFYVHVADDHKAGNCICFKCEARGLGMAGLVALVEGIDAREARRMLIRKVVRLRRPEKPRALVDRLALLRDAPERPKHAVDVPLPSTFVPVYDGKRWRVPKYLKERGVTRDAMAFFGMGFCSSGRYAGRVVLPIVCPTGRSFTARDTTGSSTLKYLNPRKTLGRGMACEVCDVVDCVEPSHRAEHSRLLYGWPTVKPGADLFVVEGPLDVVRLWQHGLSAVAILGKSLSAEQAEMVYAAGASSVVVMLDPEEKQAPLKVATTIRCAYDDVFLARLPDGVDPGESTREQVMDAYLAAERFVGDRLGGLAASLKALARRR